MKTKSDKKSNPPITTEVRLIMPQAFHTGIEVLRYFSCPIRRKRAADPINEIACSYDNRRKFLEAFLKSSRRFMRTFSENAFYLFNQCVDDFPYERQLTRTFSKKEQSEQLESSVLM
jgi:hypothetical protein